LGGGQTLAPFIINDSAGVGIFNVSATGEIYITNWINLTGNTINFTNTGQMAGSMGCADNELKKYNIATDFWDCDNAVPTNNNGTETADYIMFTDGTTYFAKNGTTGLIDFSNTALHLVFNDIRNELDPTRTLKGHGGKIFMKAGNYTLTTNRLVFNVDDLWLQGAGIITIPKISCNIVLF